MNQLHFEARLLFPGTWQIVGDGCVCYLLEGSREALMVDAGCSRANIREYAQNFTESPIRAVINTHSHFDHTGGNGYFDAVYITEADSRSAKTVMDDVPADFPRDYGFTFVRDGDLIDIGDRKLKIIELGCHSAGSIAVLDESKRLLFCGDEVDAGQVLLLPGYAEYAGQIHGVPASPVEDCLRVMEKLAGLKQYYDYLCPAHNGAPMDPVYLEWFAELCRRILDGRETGSPDCSSRSYRPSFLHYPLPDAGYRRASYKGAALVYNSRLLRHGDKAAIGAELPPATRLHLVCSRLTYDAVK